MIDWDDSEAMVSKYFKVRELTYLPSWDCYHNPSDQEKVNLITLANKMDEIRDILGKPIKVHVAIRPGALNCPSSPHHGDDYNAAIGGAPSSAHKGGLAMDFDCGEDCDFTRESLEFKLDDLCIRLERNPGGNWVHVDLVAPHPHRYFNP